MHTKSTWKMHYVLFWWRKRKRMWKQVCSDFSNIPSDISLSMTGEKKGFSFESLLVLFARRFMCSLIMPCNEHKEGS